ncbi:hypothetical protein TNCV_3285961 [Trichonephila clavipes]|nr:hypothetical protein TNCV_3285961 [Trichonephila clavipes]
MSGRPSGQEMRSGRSPLACSMAKAVKGAAFRSQSTRFGLGSNPTSNHVPKLNVREIFHVLGWPIGLKALRLGRIPLLWAWFSGLNLRKRSARVRMAERSKALRQDGVHCGMDQDHFDNVILFSHFFSFLLNVGESSFICQDSQRSKALSVPSPLLWAWVQSHF